MGTLMGKFKFKELLYQDRSKNWYRYNPNIISAPSMFMFMPKGLGAIAYYTLLLRAKKRAASDPKITCFFICKSAGKTTGEYVFILDSIATAYFVEFYTEKPDFQNENSTPAMKTHTFRYYVKHIKDGTPYWMLLENQNEALTHAKHNLH